jgi:hypothetical protein
MPPALPARPAAQPPAIVSPAPYEVAFGEVAASVPAGTRFALLLVDGRPRATVRVTGRHVRIAASLPPHDATLRVVAIGASGWRRASRPVGPVLGFPRAAAPRPAGNREDAALARRLRALVRSFGGSAGVFVQDLRSGRGAAWNARARFPAASALKLAIAVETLRALPAPPARGSGVDATMRAMLLDSDNAAANRLEVLIGGSTSGGSARINATLRALGLTDTDMYGGYELGRRTARAIPIRIESQPAIGNTKHSTAWDLARLLRDVQLAAGGRGPLRTRIAGFAPREARYLLYLLAHVHDHGKLDRFLPPWARTAHKAGWNSVARCDNGLVLWPGGAFVATVMTYAPGGAGTSADVLAGRVARAALDRFRALRRG